ncbi:tRNA lysidine(34) synthetase TilS [Agrobacterium sp. CG674]
MTPIAPLLAARQFIDKISKPTTLLVAVSGGSDSTGLLIALHRVLRDAGRSDISIHAVTIDHALRAESAMEAQGVRSLCERLDIPHHIRGWDADKPKSGLSGAARLARYGLIGAVAQDISADMAVVGHTLGDQQETIAMRSARSTRADNLGLAGMADAVLYDRRLWILRPFLNCTRQDIRDFLCEQGLSWYDDPSNDDMKYERVRMRKEASGMLIDRSINRAELSEQAAQLIEDHAISDGGNIFALKREALNADPATLRYALSALGCVVGGRRFAMAAESMDKVMACATQDGAGKITAGRVMFDRRKDFLYLVREERGIETTEVPAGETRVWDERFEIKNNFAFEMVVRPCGKEAQGAGVVTAIPAGVARRAWQTMPMFQGQQGEVLSAGNVSCSRMIAPYDLFLPRFDLKLANAIASLVGRAAFPLPPV